MGRESAAGAWRRARDARARRLAHPTQLSLALCASLLAAGVGGPPAHAAEDAPAAARRAIVVSIDALNEGILKKTLTPQQVPTLHAIFAEGACATHAVTAFPSLTAPSHAAIWTGAYGDISGISGNAQHRLPRNEHTILETWSGFHYAPLRAEPLWIAAGRQGLQVAAHHTTQAPGVPGYLPRSGQRSDALEEERQSAKAILAGDKVMAVNGYNRMIAGDAVLTGESVAWSGPEAWQGLEALETGVSPRAFTFENAAGVFHGLLYGKEAYDSVLLSASPDVSGAVRARAAAAEPANRPDELARHFSPALEVPLDGGRVFLRARLFHIAPDGADFMLFHPRLHLTEANNESLQRAYDAAVRGWIGNSAMGLYRQGAFGPRYSDGGDGEAERRFLETAELMTRQSMRAAEWFWRDREPQLMLDYFPLSDTTDHTLLGFLDTAVPQYDEALAESIRSFRASAWRYTDMRIRHLRGLADAAGAALFVTGDHGMRPSWKVFHPNVVLRQAGLLSLDEKGEVDLSRTRAYAPHGHWITVNTEDWKDGIVSEGDKPEVVARVAAALTGARSGAGESVVTRVYTPQGDAGLGLGSPAAGDVFWGLQPGFRASAALEGDTIVQAASLTAGHGFPSTDPDMFTVFCASGAAFPPGRIDAIRTIDIAPTVSAYVGIEAPRDAVGRSVLEQLLSPRENAGD